ncbi:hypothetical protein GGR51DRAFT_132359 [Nemania sp. FL0031]|nr:hypothetical protein GGR51DRAFT_132359 [Nemania sp. FL0031]
MSDAYLRTGRGGAGNLYSQKDIEEAVAKDRKEDIEAQKAPAHLHPDDNSTAPTTAPSTSTSTGGAGAGAGYARSGRGGAGNFVAAPNPSHPSPSPSHSPSAFPPSSTGHPVAAPGSSKYSGRGGAGNWSDESEGARRAKVEQERRRQDALDAGIAREIRASLAQPPRTYHLHQPGRGRRPEDDVVDV